MTGKSGTKHWIDIHWKSKYSLATHKVAVEGKGFNNSVTDELIAAFDSVLEDLDGVHDVNTSQMGCQNGSYLIN